MVLRSYRAPPSNSATVQVRTPSGRWLVLDARRLTEDRFDLILPDHVLDALSPNTAPSRATSTGLSRSNTPPPAYSPPPPSYAASWNDTLSHPAPPAARVPAQSAFAFHAATAPVHPGFSFQAMNAPAQSAFSFHATAQPDPRPDIKETSYKMPRAERIYCYFSKGATALNNVPPLNVFPSPPTNGDTYVHHPTSGQFAHQLWYYWNDQWVKSRTLAPHPAGRDYVLHWCPSSLTTRWMKRGSCKKDRIPVR
ncbi:hypothetical protein PENSPDRAFT_646004 [Peniophora sp. CONT]|nr:hypothetical protein PENSPDRAFT_646004 [Peniophora sp. CONT]